MFLCGNSRRAGQHPSFLDFLPRLLSPPPLWCGDSPMDFLPPFFSQEMGRCNNLSSEGAGIPPNGVKARFGNPIVFGHGVTTVPEKLELPLSPRGPWNEFHAQRCQDHAPLWPLSCPWLVPGKIPGILVKILSNFRTHTPNGTSGFPVVFLWEMFSWESSQVGQDLGWTLAPRIRNHLSSLG